MKTGQKRRMAVLGFLAVVILGLGCKITVNAPQPEAPVPEAGYFTLEPLRISTENPTASLTASPPPSHSVTASFTPLPSPTYTPTPTATPTLLTMKMMFWEAWFQYDAAMWMEGGASYVPSITHRNIPNCMIYEQGPTEPPEIGKTIYIGAVQYHVAEIFRNGTHHDWYMAIDGPHGPFAMGWPTLIVQGTVDQWDTCVADAFLVLATLTDVEPVGGAAGVEGTPSVPGFTCAGALPTRLLVGGYAYVSLDPPLANRVRSGPGKEYPVLGNIQPGKAMKILSGPACANRWVWWEVEELDTGLTGWTAEGDKQGYWLIPCAAAETCGIR